MVLEMLLRPRAAERSPWELFFIGVLYSTVAIFLSLLIFDDNVGLVVVFLTTLACTYLIQATLRVEERKDVEAKGSEVFLLREHWKALSFMLYLFVGFVVAFSFWYVVLPSGMAHDVFGLQEDTIAAINAPLQGRVTSGTFFIEILVNNVKVLLFTLLFAFFYGAGAIFILAWNAAVVGTAVGMAVRSSIAAATAQLGLVGMHTYFSSFAYGLLRYMTHGIFEILAYFIAALAGGIISIAVVRHDFMTRKFKRILLDSVDLVVLSLLALVFAAFVEVYVTPVLF